MTDAQKLVALADLTGEADTSLLETYLAFARDIVIRRRYPFGDGTETFPEEYDDTQIRIAQYLFLRTGAEGEIVHLENGISRHWEDGDIPPTLLRQIVPKGGAL